MNDEKSKLVIFGAGGHGKVVAEIAEAVGFSQITFLDQSWPEKTKNGRWVVAGKPEKQDANTFCAIGNNVMRANLFKKYDLYNSPILSHPSSVISPTVKLGSGTLLVAGTIVNSDTTVGRGVILNTSCSLDHDCVIGEFVHIALCALSGGVHVGDGTWIGIGASVREGVRIGKM